MGKLITLTTDFGNGSPYVAQMKAAMLTVHSHVTLIDLTHSISPQNIQQAAFVVDVVAITFPDDTIHVCVVDPGVGTQRKIVYARIGEHHFIAPDNGLLSLVARRAGCSRLVAIENSEYWRPTVSATFHGRDIMAPVAAHLSAGVEPGKFGPPHPQLEELSWPKVHRGDQSLAGEVVFVDHFGNLTTNITRSMLPPDVESRQISVVCGDRECDAWVRTYGEQPAGTLVAIIGSSEHMEIAVPDGNAASILSQTVGTPVRVSWA